MRGASLESFLFLFTLKSFVAMGNVYPTTGSQSETHIEHSRDNNIIIPINDAVTSATAYTCVYIPPNLDFCRFNR